MSQSAEAINPAVVCDFQTGRFTVSILAGQDSVLEMVASAQGFSHAETFGHEAFQGEYGFSALQAFLQRAAIGYHDSLAGELKPGWYWVRYTGLFETRDTPAEWSGYHWGSVSFAGLPYGAVSVLDSLPGPPQFGPIDRNPSEDMIQQMREGHRLILDILNPSYLG